MGKVIDMTGRESEFFTVLRQSAKVDKSHCTYWYCRCVCGRVFEARGHDIRRGRQKSCGCKSQWGKARTHGATAADASKEARKTYSTWSSMLARCYNPKSTGFRYYGARGVTVCDRWNPEKGGSFENFVADMGYRAKNTTIGRWFDIGNYEPGNCRWQTRAEQGMERVCKRVWKEIGCPDFGLSIFRTARSPQPIM